MIDSKIRILGIKSITVSFCILVTLWILNLIADGYKK